jgi:hypothetical protein
MKIIDSSKNDTILRVNQTVKIFLKYKKIDDFSGFFMLIKELMEYVEKINSITSGEKQQLVYDNIVILLYRNYNIEEAGPYIVLINAYIETLILISKSKLLLNLKKNFLKRCF